MKHTPRTRSSWWARAASVAAICLCVCSASPGESLFSLPEAFAQQDAAKEALANEAFDGLLQSANKAYNDEQYERAVELYTSAIQALPMRPEPYRNMARAYFWGGQYDAALSYYDTYLTTFPQAEDREQIERERRLTSDRTSKPWQLPETQRAAMRSLEAALAGEEMYARGGGGAWQSYQALLRTGYAQPALGKLRDRLLAAMLEEHDAALAVKTGQTSPELDDQQWALQRERALAAKKLVTTKAQLEDIKRREKIHEAAEALLLSRYEDAALYSEQAIAENPDALYLRWFFITALMRSNKSEQALRELERLEERLKVDDVAQLEYVEVVRALLLQQRGKHDEAAEIYEAIFLR